jgi:hypothetical protein
VALGLSSWTSPSTTPTSTFSALCRCFLNFPPPAEQFPAGLSGLYKLNIFLGFFKMYFIQHCFICRHSDSIVAEDAGIVTRTVVALAWTVRSSNYSARSQMFSFNFSTFFYKIVFLYNDKNSTTVLGIHLK